MTFRRLALGREGEAMAERHLLGIGYKLLERGCRNRLGEIDLVMQDGDTVVFVEVKTRSSRRFGGAEEAVDRRKQRKIAQVALAYIRDRGLDRCSLRFDVVAIQDAQVRHIPDAFQPSGYAW